ncbi:MAG: hypothetical protein J6126_05815 [Clostridia bacterium]|nr:hypothetical protein [Clostridia bacterium]
MLYLDNKLKSMIKGDSKADDIRRYAVENGMVEMNTACRDIVLNGITDMSEFVGINVE